MGEANGFTNGRANSASGGTALWTAFKRPLVSRQLGSCALAVFELGNSTERVVFRTVPSAPTG
jgi:hypothetical protein